MRVFVAVDDTDNLESVGTGHLTEFIAQAVEENGWGKRSYITRHQLFVHPDVPYTSHNSAMCFTADVDPERLEALIAHASGFLEKERAEGSDPGLCLAVADRLESDEEIEAIVAFGRKAKEAVLKKDDAYELARRLGIHLSEHGGTGQGVIGALAGIGLRMSGNDGRIRGKLEIGNGKGAASVGEIRAHPGVDAVRSLDGWELGDEELVLLGEKVKAVLQDGKAILLVMPSGRHVDGPQWRTCTKDILKAY